jgi:hypothetical protein
VAHRHNFDSQRHRYAVDAHAGSYLAEILASASGVRNASRLSVTVKLIAGTVLAVFAVTAAQISMQRPGLTGVPQGRKMTARPQAPVTLTEAEQKQLNTAIKHMKRKDRKRLAEALQKMSPQQRQQLLASVKRQLAQGGATAQGKKGSR